MAQPLMKLRCPVQIEDRLLFRRKNIFEGPGVLGDLLQLVGAIAHSLRHLVQLCCRIDLGACCAFVGAMLFLQVEFLRKRVEIALRMRHRIEVPVLRMFARGRAPWRFVRCRCEPLSPALFR